MQAFCGAARRPVRLGGGSCCAAWRLGIMPIASRLRADPIKSYQFAGADGRWTRATPIKSDQSAAADGRWTRATPIKSDQSAGARSPRDAHKSTQLQHRGVAESRACRTTKNYQLQRAEIHGSAHATLQYGRTGFISSLDRPPWQGRMETASELHQDSRQRATPPARSHAARTAMVTAAPARMSLPTSTSRRFRADFHTVTAGAPAALQHLGASRRRARETEIMEATRAAALEVGHALLRMHSTEDYLDEFPNWTALCNALGIGRQDSYDLMNAVEVIESLQDAGVSAEGMSRRHARVLARVPPAERAEVLELRTGRWRHHGGGARAHPSAASGARRGRGPAPARTGERPVAADPAGAHGAAQPRRQVPRCRTGMVHCSPGRDRNRDRHRRQATTAGRTQRVAVPENGAFCRQRAENRQLCAKAAVSALHPPAGFACTGVDDFAIGTNSEAFLTANPAFVRPLVGTGCFSPSMITGSIEPFRASAAKPRARRKAAQTCRTFAACTNWIRPIETIRGIGFLTRRPCAWLLRSMGRMARRFGFFLDSGTWVATQVLHCDGFFEILRAIRRWVLSRLVELRRDRKQPAQKRGCTRPLVGPSLIGERSLYLTEAGQDQTADDRERLPCLTAAFLRSPCWSH